MEQIPENTGSSVLSGVFRQIGQQGGFMALCIFSNAYLTMGVTPVENLFIWQYLTHAPGDYVRVYLFGLMMCHHPADSMSLEKMAHILGMNEDDVKNAFQYWERQGIVRRTSDSDPSFEFLNVASVMDDESPMEKSVYLHRDFNNRLQQLFDNRLLHPADFTVACEWVEELGLSEEVVLALVAHYSQGRKKSFRFRDFDSVAMQWAEAGVTSLQDAQVMIDRDSAPYKLAKKVLETLGMRRNPSQPERELARKWIEDWGMDEKAVIAACRETTKGRNPTLSYLDSILQRNVHAKTGDEMTDSLDGRDALHETIKALHEALGIAQSAPTEQEKSDYRDILGVGFEPGAVMRVARSMGVEGRGRYGMDDLNRQLMRFAEKGLFTDMQVAEYLDQQRLLKEQAARVFEKAGQDSKVNAAAAAQMEEWLSCAAFPLILHAAECARGTRTPSQYITKLLKAWRDAGITTVEEARRRMPPPAAANRGGVQQPTYEMRSYTEDELNAMTVDLKRYLEEHKL